MIQAILRTLTLIAIVGFLVSWLSLGTATADDDGPFEGDTIRVVVGYGAGGGYDTYARFLAPKLADYTGATVVVENRTGGGGTVAANQVFQAPADGRTIMLINALGAALGQLTGKEGVRYDMSRFTWLGRVVTEDYVWLVNADSPYRSIADVVADKKTIVFAAGSKADALSDLEAMTCKALELSCKIIIGYKGSKESALAVVRGEAGSITLSSSSARRYTKDSSLRAIAALGRQRAAFFPDTPTVFESVTLSDEAAWWIDTHAKLRELGRSMVAPPGLPAGKADHLRRALKTILSDPAVIDEAAAIRRKIHYMEPEKLAANADDVLGGLSADRVRAVRHVILEQYF
jgi:tripartite-type tricarboxylate transporter receptor subunit TctC